MSEHTYTQRTPQRPIPSGYGPRTTAQDIVAGIDLRGKIAIVTGGYSGLGLEVSRILAQAGAHIVLPARSPGKAAAAAAAVPGAELAEMDLADPASIDRFAAGFEATGRPLHLLIQCAGIMALPELRRDERGYELQLATNHLGHFQLAARLWPALRRAGSARVVSVSSGAHRFSAIRFEDPNYLHRPYAKWEAYGQSKTANALFALALDRKGAPYGVRAFSAHPGSVVTDLSRHLSDDEMKAMGALDDQGRRTYSETTEERKTVPEGAATIVWCAVGRQLDGQGGVYCRNADIAEPVPSEQLAAPGANGVWPWAMDEDAAERLWTLSERLTEVPFAI
ncbi:SDR family NAD(P)-dependent oxidoreductase [Cohnella cellulosilytica]|uniref:SDR family NAD(P)-dependent oxidoreductase n=1 Tax=Cohnella cellulosilytica TaxID=986710 RepID=A0ABW2F6S9_9BACL